MQARAGVADRMRELGPRLIRDHMPEQHREFFAQLPFLVVGSIGPDGQPAASIVAAAPGFAHALDPRRLRIDACAAGSDPLNAALKVGAPIGLLGIEAQTRRRNRMNGVVVEADARGFTVEVRQSFGNCPKYIQAREPAWLEGAAAPMTVREGHRLTADARRVLAAADTFFIATSHAASDASSPGRGVDVSHRGGKPGFVRVAGDDMLTVPDFTGNAFFNTLGNIAVQPKAGLAFVDFDSGDLLQLEVQAEIVWDGQELASFAGAERLLRMRVTAVRHVAGSLPLRWGRAQMSPYLAATGQWVIGPGS